MRPKEARQHDEGVPRWRRVVMMIEFYHTSMAWHGDLGAGAGWGEVRSGEARVRHVRVRETANLTILTYGRNQITE